MSKEKLLTIAIPCYNSQDYLARAMKSILIGDNRIEIIIVDDGSTDSTPELADNYAKKYPDIVRVIHKENGGHGDAVMTGLAAALGKYYKVLDSDDWLNRRALAAVMNFIAENEAIDNSFDMIISDYVYEKLGKKLLLPVDSVMIDDFPNPIDAPVETEVFDADKMDANKEGCDIGPKTIELYSDAVKTAKTVVWNGPMGVFENPILATGTKAVAAALAETDATTIIGGGDSAAAVNQLGFGDKMSHISTGGGASLEFLEGKELPGVAAANDK